MSSWASWLQGENHAHMKSVWNLPITCLKWSDMQKESRETEYYNTCHSRFKFELNLNLNRPRNFGILCKHAIDRKYMERVIQRKKNHSIWINSLKDTTTGIWIWIWNKFKFKSVQNVQILFHAKVESNMSV